MEKPITELSPRASQAVGMRVDDPSTLPPAGDGAAAVPPPLPQAIDQRSGDAQVLVPAAAKASGEPTSLPQTLVGNLTGEVAPMEAYIEAKMPVMKALPLPDLFYGGGVLVVVVILQAIGLRLLTGHFDKRAQAIEKRPRWWSVDLLLGGTVFTMLGLHLASIVLWSAALVHGGIIPQWVPAARFAALSYTTLGSGFELPAEWHMLAPIIAISGMFTFAWTASVLVSIVGQCNHLRGVVREARQARRSARKGGRPTVPPPRNLNRTGAPAGKAYGA